MSPTLVNEHRTSLVESTMAEFACRLDYYLVLDFEATCDQRKAPKPQEIIEFPVLKVNAKTLTTESVFHTYVQPTAHSILTPFCTELTGITQDKVDGQPTLAEALRKFHSWLESNGLLNPGVSFCFVTCGDWDLKKMLPGQCKYLNIPIQDYFCRWINIQLIFRDLTRQTSHQVDLLAMLKYFNIPLDGRQHSGIDDSKNIAKILAKLAEIQPNIQPTTTLPTFSSYNRFYFRT